ncbi:MAG: peptidylprolyl isomerase [Dermatophilaceae bacterium]
MVSVKDSKPVLAVLAVLLVVVGFVVLANVLTAPKTDSTAQATSTATDTATDTATETATESPSTPQPTPAALAGCTPVPPAQTDTKRMASAPDPASAKGKTFIATIKTNCGDITVELDGTKAPATVASFNLLASENYWAPSPCHRLTTDTDGLWVLQCGDPTGTGSGPGPGYHFGIENAPSDGSYPRGTVAMARSSDPNSNKDQFFITYKDTQLPTDGGGYTIFGKVTGGMDIIDKVAATGVSPADQATPLGQLSILSVSVKEKA